MTYREYEDAVRERLWAWADAHHRGELDDGKRAKRPPVLARECALRNVLVPPDDARANEIRAAVPVRQHHRWFRSLKSSQALAQSVFGAIRAFGRLDLLRDVTTDCGRPAFFEDCRGWKLELEHDVRGLGEPRPTSVDVLLSTTERRIAVECKFTETEFGTCSRPRLRPKDASWPEQHCNGNYEVQRERRSRCSLTEIGVRYWDHLPELFDWPAGRDHAPCPFGELYQLARNALGAALSAHGGLAPTRGHALVIYDTRNPAFQRGGKAREQRDRLIRVSRIPGLVRSVGWQPLMAAVARAPEFRYLVDGVERKYGIEPS